MGRRPHRREDPLLHIKTISKKRICKWKGCNTILSKYNTNKYCFAHLRKAWEVKAGGDYDKSKK